MSVMKAGADAIVSFDTSLLAGDATHFNVYRGVLARVFDGHAQAPGGCTIPGPIYTDLNALSSGSSDYYLVVAACTDGLGGELEGSYGQSSLGDERPPAASPCP